MDKCLDMEQYKQGLYELASNSNLTLGAIYHITQLFMLDLETRYRKEITMEQQKIAAPSIEKGDEVGNE